MRIPKIASIQEAVEIYYQNITLGNKEINALFGGIGSDKISELKKAARAQMEADSVPSYNGFDVSTISAYKAWGLDINDLTNRYRIMKKVLGG
jgi:hypothetical protein